MHGQSVGFDEPRQLGGRHYFGEGGTLPLGAVCIARGIFGISVGTAYRTSLRDALLCITRSRGRKDLRMCGAVSLLGLRVVSGVNRLGGARRTSSGGDEPSRFRKHVPSFTGKLIARVRLWETGPVS
ncbi:hypothetical protein TNCT_512161 [Trichonephila clavata]|uniref:Uncharacterized protein n=1 Tax=Trichonephila clavata TaxID=2740835 RepID=A0A8X6FLB2_TRICU|nr:hypothetical protein TNCT_512161 [Trichonephila clavata]